MQSSLGQQNVQQAVVQNTYQPVPQNNIQQAQPQTAYVQQPQVQPVQTYQPQVANVPVPNYSGVNIQIFNPTVSTPSATAPVYNVNAPNYGSNPATGCYPPNYYTNNLGTNPNNNVQNQPQQETKKTEEKKTEKREIVQLTDEYIKTLENYLNSQDKEVRLMGAKEVIARLEEDHSRKDDKALNALINKMLQDPSTPVKVLALGALDSRVVTGDDYTVAVLKNMQNSQSGFGQDAVQATNILLKMAGQKVEKEFEVKDTPKQKQNGEK